jgi:hypothetical protein
MTLTRSNKNYELLGSVVLTVSSVVNLASLHKATERYYHRFGGDEMLLVLFLCCMPATRSQVVAFDHKHTV